MDSLDDRSVDKLGPFVEEFKRGNMHIESTTNQKISIYRLLLHYLKYDEKFKADYPQHDDIFEVCSIFLNIFFYYMTFLIIILIN